MKSHCIKKKAMWRFYRNSVVFFWKKKT